MELIYRQKYPISAIHTDCYGRAKPSVLLYLAQEVAGEHCMLLGTDWDTLQKQNLFWALIRTHVQITKLPTLGQTLTVETWPMPQTRTAYPRCTVGYDEKGRECFRCISLWVLMDTQSRAMVLPGKANVQVPGMIQGTEPEAPKAIPAFQGDNTQCRTVRFAELDRNLHMNNTKYLDWVMDLYDSRFHGNQEVEELTVCYLSEAREADILTLSYGMDETGLLTVDGRREKTDVLGGNERVFAAKVKFKRCSVNQ